MPRALPEHRCRLKVTANRSRLVRRDLRELIFGASKTTLSVLYLIREKAKTTLFDFSHCAESVAEKGEFARLFKGVPLYIAQRGKKRRRAAARRTSVVPSNHDFFFCQHKRKSVKKVSRFLLFPIAR